MPLRRVEIRAVVGLAAEQVLNERNRKGADGVGSLDAIGEVLIEGERNG